VIRNYANLLDELGEKERFEMFEFGCPECSKEMEIEPNDLDLDGPLVWMCPACGYCREVTDADLEDPDAVDIAHESGFFDVPYP